MPTAISSRSLEFSRAYYRNNPVLAHGAARPAPIEADRRTRHERCAAGKVKAGDVTARVGVVQMDQRGINVANWWRNSSTARERRLLPRAEFTTYYYTILRMNLAGC